MDWETYENLVGDRFDDLPPTLARQMTADVYAAAHADLGRRAEGGPRGERRPRVGAIVRRVLEAHARAHLARVRSTLTPAEWGALLVAHDYRCAYCGVPGGTHMDHVVPLSRGGENTAANVAPACRACNLSKRALPLDVWAKSRGLDLTSIRGRIDEARARAEGGAS